MDPCRPPKPDPTRPDFVLPPGACDSHCHIFGPHDVFPYAARRPFTPPDAPKEQLRALHEFLGVGRAVLVQSAVHGADHAALLDALDSRPDDYRGVALLGPDASRDVVAELDEHGVCGVRFHLTAHLGVPPRNSEIDAVLALVRPFGWHAAFHVFGKDLVAHQDYLAAVEGPVVIDHMARVDLSDDAAGDCLLRLLDRGNVWVKLSAPERISRQPAPFADAVRFARSLAEHAPDRVVWGTDYPHPNIPGEMVDDGALVDLVPLIAPDPVVRGKMLVDNPAALFGFRT
jgi:2-pyrone-4,6-dicarboxylate lactonase